MPQPRQAAEWRCHSGSFQSRGSPSGIPAVTTLRLILAAASAAICSFCATASGGTSASSSPASARRDRPLSVKGSRRKLSPRSVISRSSPSVEAGPPPTELQKQFSPGSLQVRPATVTRARRFR